MDSSADADGNYLVYGVDIGDWNGAVAVGRPGTAFDLLATRVLPAAVGVTEDGTQVAGWPAYRKARHEPDGYRRGLNRVFGQDEQIWLCERPVDTGHLMSLLLRELRKAAETAVPGIPDRVAIAVPDGWGETRRAAIQAAAAAAGFEAQRLVLVDRAIAAATLMAERMVGDHPQHLLVYHLGGTSFACTLVRRTATGRLIALGQTSTRTDVGAADFDQELIAKMAGRSLQVSELLDLADPDEDQRHRIAGLQQLAEELKIRLSTAPRASEYVTLVQPGFAFEMDREAFEEAIRLSITATVVTCESLLSRHQMGWSDVDAVVLAGGGANLPAVGRALATASGRSVEAPHEPELTVAAGAARHAGQEVQAVREAQRGPRSDQRVPVTGRLAPVTPVRGLYAAALAAWTLWAVSGGWYTWTHWYGLPAWGILGTGALMALLLIYGYHARLYALAATGIGLAVILGVIHLLTLLIYSYQQIFTNTDVGWIPFAGLLVGTLALLGFGTATDNLETSVNKAREVKLWAASRRALTKRLLHNKEIGVGELPATVHRLVNDFPAARGFSPATGPFNFAIVHGRILLLGSTKPGDRPPADDINAAIAAYLGPPSRPRVSSDVTRSRYAERPINVHCFLIGEIDSSAESYLNRVRPALRNAAAADPYTGQPAISTSLALIEGGDLETRLQRLLERADQELYLPLLERAAEAADIKS